MPRQPLGVLILHGFTGSVDSVRRLEAPIQALGIPTHMPALRGHGAPSPAALRGVTWHDWVDDAEAALQALLMQAQRAIVVGHSMGGLVALTLAAEHPQAVDSLVLAAPALQLASPLAPGRPLHGLTPLIRRLVKSWPIPHLYTNRALAEGDTNYPWAPIDAILSLFEFLQVTRRRLPEIRVPTLILQSHQDSVVVPDCAEAILQAIATPEPQKRIVWFERTQHQLFRDCELDATIGAVVDFVRGRLDQAGNPWATAIEGTPPGHSPLDITPSPA
ncbi:alpha/beta hydrolase [Vulcanococcus limneticus]|uniref:alpha/beta hydrolase n=1 Tax=Vulcanococcus limneticus TaxID=2170428 RepID=UPI00398BC989